MRHRTWPPCGDPALVGCERCLDLRLLDDLGRGTPLDCLKPPQVRQGHDGRFPAAQLYHLVSLSWIRDGVLRSHAATVPAPAVRGVTTRSTRVWDINVGNWRVAAADQRDLSVVLFQMRGQAA
jgi:hypothetical protein